MKTLQEVQNLTKQNIKSQNEIDTKSLLEAHAMVDIAITKACEDGKYECTISHNWQGSANKMIATFRKVADMYVMGGYQAHIYSKTERTPNGKSLVQLRLSWNPFDESGDL